MRLFKVCMLSALLSTIGSSAYGVSAYIAGGGQVSSTTGSLQIIVDTAPELLPMEQGGVELGVSSLNPGFLRFTSATVHNPVIGTEMNGDPIRRWTVTNAVASTDEAFSLIFGASLFTPGLSSAYPSNPLIPGGTEFLFATIDYEILSPSGSTDIDLFLAYPNEGAGFVDKGNVIPGSLTGTVLAIPEPCSQALAGVGLFSLIFRRRNA